MSTVFKEQHFDRSLTRDGYLNRGLPRSVEFLLAAGGLVVLFPILLVCGILVWAGSRGPMLFRQQRVGRGGRMFTLYKFRSMEISQSGPSVTAANDRRITRFGRVLRKWKLDELPELYNVLRGDMSFVGPRPEVAEFVDLSDPFWQTILTVRPGITDPVTLFLRNEEAILAGAEDRDSFYRDTLQPFKLNGYLHYIRIKDARTDIKMIAQTIKVIVLPHKAPLSHEMLEMGASDPVPFAPAHSALFPDREIA